MNIHVCFEHIELAVDVIVDECEIAPNLENITETAVEKCAYCQNTATYVVSN